MTQNLFCAFSFLFSFLFFSVQRNCKTHIFIQCSHFTANLCQSAIPGLKILIEQLLEAVGGSRCGRVRQLAVLRLPRPC